jgi:ribosomal protein S13
MKEKQSVKKQKELRKQSMEKDNKKLAKIFYEIEEYLTIKGVKFKPRAYQKAARALEGLEKEVSEICKEEGVAGLEKIQGVGRSIAEKIQEYLKTGKIKYHQELKEETAVRQVVTHYFQTKGLTLEELKNSARKRKIIYSRYTKPAKQLLELAGSVDKAKRAIDKVAEWAKSRNLDYAVETVFKKWLELDRLKPKEIVKKPFYLNKPLVWSRSKQKWFVVDETGEWLEFNGKEEDVEWRIEK